MTVQAPERLTENCNNKKAPGLNVFVYVKTIKNHNRVLLDRNAFIFFHTFKIFVLPLKIFFLLTHKKYKKLKKCVRIIEILTYVTYLVTQKSAFRLKEERCVVMS